MNRLFPALAGAALLLSACGGSSTPSATPTSSRELLSFSSASLGTAYVGESYSGTIAPLGGTGPYSVRLVSGTLPSGLKFSGGNSGTISGTPSAVGSSTFTLEVSDANLSVKTQVFNVSVAELPPLDFVPTLPNGEVRGETRIPLTLMGPRGVRAARFSWVLPDNAQVIKVVTTGSNEAGRPLLFWKQSGHTLMLDFGFRLTPKNGVQVALISLKPLNDKPVSLGSVTSGSTSFLLAQDGAGKVLREVKPAPPTPAASPAPSGVPAGANPTGSAESASPATTDPDKTDSAGADAPKKDAVPVPANTAGPATQEASGDSSGSEDADADPATDEAPTDDTVTDEAANPPTTEPAPPTPSGEGK